MRAVLTTLIEVAGAAAVTVGALMVSASLGIMVGGTLAIVGGYLGGRE